MKKKLLSFCLFFFVAIIIVAQQDIAGPGGPGIIPPPNSPIELHFNYDQSGNQIKRYSPYSKSAVQKEIVTENVIEEDEKLKDQNLLEYFPNPVENELTITWVKSIGIDVKSIQIYSLDSRIVENFSIAKNTQEYRILLGHLANGVYIVKVLFDNGKQISFKVIKK